MASPATVNFTEWLPDQPALNNGGATEAKNVIPAARGYRSFPSLAPVSSSLPGRVYEAFAGKDMSGGPVTVAGTQTGLFKMDGTNWVDVSGTEYSVPELGGWKFAQYGDRIIATNGIDPMQSFLMGQDTEFSDLSNDAPKARHIAIIKDFVMVGDCEDPVYGSAPNSVWWCSIDNPTAWPAPGSTEAQTTQSDRQPLPNGGFVMGIVGGVGGLDGVVFMENSVYRVVFQGPPTIFGFFEVERARGAVCSGGIVHAGNMIYYLANDGFYAFNGAGSQPIGAEKVNKWFWSNVNQSNLDRIRSVVDPINNIVMWAFPSTVSADGTPDMLLIYNFVLNRFSWAELPCETIFRDYTAALDLEDLDGISPSIDALPFSLDSRVWIGGKLALSCVDQTHKVGRLAGTSLEAVIDTPEFSAGSGMRMRIDGVRPMVEGAAGVSSQIMHRADLSADPIISASSTAGADGVCRFRLSTRYARARVTIPAGEAWSAAIGCEAEYSPDGRR